MKEDKEVLLSLLTKLTAKVLAISKEKDLKTHSKE